MFLVVDVGGPEQQLMLVFGDVPRSLIVMMLGEVSKRISERQASVRLAVRHQRVPAQIGTDRLTVSELWL